MRTAGDPRNHYLAALVLSRAPRLLGYQISRVQRLVARLPALTTAHPRSGKGTFRYASFRSDAAV